MAELWYGHFDSTPEDPRMLLAADWARFIASFVTDGIRNGGTCLQVTAGTGLNVNVDNGIACILGYIIRLETDLQGRYYQVNVPAAHLQHPRIDRLVLRLDRRIQERNIKPVILMGTASSSPVPPPLTRSKDVWELSLAQIRVNANTGLITSSNITDERFNTELCGLMNSVLGLDPSVWQGQFDSFMTLAQSNFNTAQNARETTFNNSQTARDTAFNTAQTERQNAWLTWFESLKIDLERYAAFNFDNIAALPGTQRLTTFTSTTQIDEKIQLTSSGALVAERRTVFGTSVTITEKLYASDGTTVLRNTTTTTTVNTDGSITEVIV